MKNRMQYAHPDRPRIPAVTKPGGPFMIMWNGKPKMVTPRKHGGERSKYQPHQSLRETERRCRVMYGGER